jgi:hypothetical protein
VLKLSATGLGLVAGSFALLAGGIGRLEVLAQLGFRPLLFFTLLFQLARTLLEFFKVLRRLVNRLLLLVKPAVEICEGLPKRSQLLFQLGAPRFSVLVLLRRLGRWALLVVSRVFDWNCLK